MSQSRKKIIKDFFNLYTSEGLGQKASWCGVPTQKCPLDAWIFQEILWENAPHLVIEVGSAKGGTALFLAMIMDRMDIGRVVTIEKGPNLRKPPHDRIEYLIGSSIDNNTIKEVEKRVNPGENVMVILDSDHHVDHVHEELMEYYKFVTPSQYLIVEDGFWMKDEKEGPAEAIDLFMRSHNDKFEIDHEREKFLVTYNPNGYLRRK